MDKYMLFVAVLALVVNTVGAVAAVVCALHR